MGNFDQFWAETLADVEPPKPQPYAVATLERPAREPVPAGAVNWVAAPAPGVPAQRPSRPPALLPCAPVVRPAAVVAGPPRGRHRARAVALAATALGLAGSLALVVAGGGALPGAEARRVTAPRTIAGASVVPAGRWGSDLARLEASVRSARVDATSAAAYGRTRGLLVLLVAGRGAAEGGHERMAAAFAGPDGAVGLSASYQVRGASVRCGDVTATTGRGVLCTWSAATTGAVWAPGAAAIADVAAFSAAAATAVR